MEIRDVSLTKTGKIVTVNIGDDSIKATLIDRGVNIKDKNNIYLSFITEKVELSNDLTESISNYEEKEEALKDIDEVVDTIKKSKNNEDSVLGLCQRFELSEKQAKAVLAMVVLVKLALSCIKRK